MSSSRRCARCRRRPPAPTLLALAHTCTSPSPGISSRRCAAGDGRRAKHLVAFAHTFISRRRCAAGDGRRAEEGD
eukprot:4375752-Prymnesium_polylepis.1